MKSNFLFKLICLISSFTFLTRTSLYCQKNPYGEVSISSPTAASLGKYADVPVSYHTGIPQIDIPIYTISAGPLSLPISLSYHASGLKAMETASWVGAGWSLNAGGVITRSVMGLPDERGTNSGSVSAKGHYSDYGYSNYLYLSGNQDWQAFNNGQKDGEPDLYFFNFAGYSGKFYFNDDRTPVLVPRQDLKIIPYYPNDDSNYVYGGLGAGSIQGFTIVTPDGMRYMFGNLAGFTGTKAFEVTNPYSSENGYLSGSAISGWYLRKMTTADGLFEINLDYTQENYGYHTVSSTPVDSYTPAGEKEFSIVKNIIQGVRLSQISFPNGTVTFNAGDVRTDLSDNLQNISDNTNTTAVSLGSIQIANASGFCKKFSFSYGYFSDNSTALPNDVSTSGYMLNTDKQRLRLDSVRESSCDNSLTIPPYRFTYFSENPTRRISFGVDHWGFMNGITGNQTLIPTYTTNDGNSITTVTGANRNAVWPFMRSGSLKKITYPLGGTTEFEFEAADDYNTSRTTQQNVSIASMTVHLFGQNTELSKPVQFTSNGNPVMLHVNNTSNFSGSFKITNSSNADVYTVNPMGSQANEDYTINLAAGTYQATFTYPQDPGTGTGATLNFSQIANVTNTVNNVVGGLRIKTIIRKEMANSANPIVTNYSYTNGGFLYSVPTYVHHVRNDLVQNLGYWTVDNGYQSNSRIASGCPLSGGYFLRSGGSLRPMETTQGYHIGYPIVKVAQNGNGYSVYNYFTGNNGFASGTKDLSIATINIQSGACESSTPNYPAAPLSFDYKKGELNFEQHYNESGQLLKDVYYTPEYNLNLDQATPAFIVQSRYKGVNVGGNILLGTYYNLTSPQRTKMTSVLTDYTPGVGSTTQTTITFYESGNHHQVTKKTTTTSMGDIMTTKTKYSSDFRVASCDATSTCLPEYTTDCSSCLATYTSAQTNCGNNGTCLTDAYLAYQQCLINARVTMVSCRKVNFTNSTNAFGSCYLSAKNSADAELKPVLELQDEWKIVPIEETIWRNDNLLSASYLKFDYPINTSTVVYPANQYIINLVTPSSSFTEAAISGSTVLRDTRYTLESTAKFYNGNLVEVRKKDGLFASYIWGYNNVLPIVKASGVDYNTLKAAYDAAGGSLATIRAQNSLSKALIASYVHSPLVGITSEADPNGKSTTYEFDLLGRVKNIKDWQGNIMKNFQYHYAANTQP